MPEPKGKSHVNSLRIHSLERSGAFGGKNDRNKYPDLSLSFLPLPAHESRWLNPIRRERAGRTWWCVSYRPAPRAQSRLESADNECGGQHKVLNTKEKFSTQRFLDPSCTVTLSVISL